MSIFLTALVVDLWGHGRVQTAIEADVRETQTTVRIRLAMTDLMSATRADFGKDFETELDARERREIAIERQAKIEQCFQLFGAQGEALQALGIWAALPDFDSEQSRNLGFEQQAIEVTLVYVYPDEPDSLTFWCDFGRDHHGYDTLGSLTIKRDGEIVMLPANVGPAFPLRWSFDWGSEVKSLAERSSLENVSANWAHRLAAVNFAVTEERARCRIVTPLRLLNGRFQGEHGGGVSGIKRLKSALVEATKMNAGGREVVARRSFLSVHSLSSTRFGNEGIEGLPAGGDALVNLELEFALEEEDQLDAYLDFSHLLDAGNQLLVTTRNGSGDRVLPAILFQSLRAPLREQRTETLHTQSP